MQPERQARWEFAFKVVGACVTLTAVVIGLVEYSIDRADAREASQINVKAPFRTMQMDVYRQSCEAASTVANLSVRDPERGKAYDRFMVLYTGPLYMVQTAPVEERASAFREYAIVHQRDIRAGERLKLMELARDLAVICRQELFKDWGVRESRALRLPGL